MEATLQTSLVGRLIDVPEERTRAAVIEPALINGDHRAWERFVRSHGRIIQGMIRQVLFRANRLQDETAADLTQDTFAKLIQKDFQLLRRFDPARSSVATYLGMIARSVALAYLRKASPDQVAAPDELPAQEVEATPQLPSYPVDLLSTRQRLVLSMLIERGMSVHEVALALGIERQTVRSMKHKAVDKLREYFASIGVAGGSYE